MATATVADDTIDPITGKKKATATDPAQPVVPVTVPIPTGGDAPPPTSTGVELKDVPAQKPAALPAPTAIPPLPAPATATPPAAAIPPMVSGQVMPQTVPIPSEAPSSPAQPAMAASGAPVMNAQAAGASPMNQTVYNEYIRQGFSPADATAVATQDQSLTYAATGANVATIAKVQAMAPDQAAAIKNADWNTFHLQPGQVISTMQGGDGITLWDGQQSSLPPQARGGPATTDSQLALDQNKTNAGAVSTLNQGVATDQAAYAAEVARNAKARTDAIAAQAAIDKAQTAKQTTVPIPDGGDAPPATGLNDLPVGTPAIPALDGTGKPQVTVPIPNGGDAPPGTELSDVPTGKPTTLPVNPYAPVTPGPGTGSTSQTPIDPTNDLRSKLLTPATDPRLATTQNLTDQAASNLAGGPNFTDLASAKFKDFITQQNEQQATDVRTLGQDAAKFGTLGSGVNTGYLGDLQRKELQDRLSEADTLASNAAGQDVTQRQQTLAALLGVENSQFGQGQTNYQDVVQQQGWQGSQSQQAIDNAAKQEGLTEQEYMDKLYGGIALGNYGDSGNPSTTQASIAAQYGDAAASDWAALATLAGKQAYQAALNAGQSPAAAKAAAVTAGG